ncbi:ribosomal protein of the small subunit, Mrps8p [Trichosporon asahii var. asahii CBS 2479]|uniref:Ribosomal protein of the small subunit, Mrps8p n=1 Tax=Trichosporon asahii var. asahii (strain ATCC 90039 / CBS 2479 / JCM 2466 / KCTC 7840 / NBRC 103889/ NCYC 2677 / UAMH 7654) TaxID=1186058 RepID=J6ERD4_TRIAS|nr:ribosomal protein of the small subunit, Mrps8p [Trichosporon asahii var. asahii CBS 2479]EJT47049.1 ribosomal protein of the small subunit, Mrps8p [Trichosporon asahii var. asahii CBS 2479]
MPTPPHRILTHIRNTSRAALASTSLPYNNAALGISSVLLRHGLLTNVSLGGPTHPAPAEFPKLPVPARRLWIDHKPSVRRGVDHEKLGLLLQGKRVNNVPGVGTGEILIVKVPKDSSMGRKGVDMYMEGWEAYTAGLGGELIARAS